MNPERDEIGQVVAPSETPRFDTEVERLTQGSLAWWVMFAMSVIAVAWAVNWGIGLAARTAKTLVGDPHHRIARAVSLIRLLVVSLAFVVILRPLLVRAPLVVGFVLLSLAVIGSRLAAEILKDGLAGLSLARRRVFREGDVIAWSDNFGTVETIGLWRTLVVTKDGARRWIPNRNLVDNEITVTSKAGVARVRCSVELESAPSMAQLERARRVLLTTPFRQPGGQVNLDVSSDWTLTAELETWAAVASEPIRARMVERIRTIMQSEHMDGGGP